jgi:hypothetical protein
MTIAELFVELSVKGSDKTVNAFKSVKTSLGEVKSMSLEAKAAILAAVYGLERMMSQGAQTGTNLTNFTALTNLSAKSLQQWKWAAQQAGVQGEEFTGSLKSVQDNVSKMLAGGGAPKGLGLIANSVGIDPKKLQDTFYMMEKFQEFAQKNKSTLATDALKSMGLSEGVIAGMRRNVFTQDNFKKAPIYGDGEIKQLDKVKTAYANLGTNIEMAFGRFTAKHGLQIVTDLTKITKAVLDLADAMMKLGAKLKVFEGFTASIDGITKIMRLASGESLDEVMKDDNKNKKRHLGQGTWWMNAIEGVQDKILEQRDNSYKYDGVPELSKNRHGGGASSLVVNQNLNFQHDGKDAQKTGKSTHDAVQKAYRQNSALKGGY